MLDHLKKFFKPEEGQVEMTETDQAAPTADTMAAELAELKANFAKVSEELGAAKEQLQQANEAVAAVAEQKAKAEADALQVKMDARLAKLKESVGDEQAESLMAATQDLDDAAFDKIANAVAATYDAEANSQMFTEAGIDAEVKEPAQVDMVTRLAAKIDAEFAPKKDAK